MNDSSYGSNAYKLFVFARRGQITNNMVHMHIVHAYIYCKHSEGVGEFKASIWYTSSFSSFFSISFFSFFFLFYKKESFKSKENRGEKKV